MNKILGYLGFGRRSCMFSDKVKNHSILYLENDEDRKFAMLFVKKG